MNRSDYNWHDSGNHVFYEDENFETICPMAPVYFCDDFIGADLVIPATGSDESGCKWTKKITANATVAKVAGASNGVVACTLTSATEAQEGSLEMDGQRNFTIGQGLIFEARIKYAILPSATAAETLIGLAIDAGGEPTHRIAFRSTGSGLLYAEQDDNSAEQTATTGVSLTTSDWAVLRIDCQSAADIKFYVNGVRVAASTTFAYTALTTYLTLQPVVGIRKSSNSAVGTVYVDYVRVWQDRS